MVPGSVRCLFKEIAQHQVSPAPAFQLLANQFERLARLLKSI